MQVALIPRTLPTDHQARRAKSEYLADAVRVGDRFGRLTVVDKRRSGTGSLCDVKCDCGGQRLAVHACKLLNGNLQSCGCLHPDTIASSAMTMLGGGVRHGQLTFVEEVSPRIAPSGKRVRMGRFRCDCGGEKVAELRNVKRGLTRSCGCLQR